MLSLRMTAALQRHSKASWLALFSEPTAKARASTWFDNANAIGFTTAAVGREDQDENPYEETAPKTQQVKLGIGLHNRFDETLGLGGGPDAPATSYDLNTDVVHDSDGGCHLTVTSWRPLNNAPWDSTEHLVVTRTAHVIVAGDPEVANDIRRVAPIAETAARFDINFFKSIHRSADIRVHGFVLFVPKSVTETNAWFSFGATSKPGGWAADVGDSATGVEYPLNGVQLPVTTPPGAPRVSKASQIGGARVAITPKGLSGNVRDQTATLVHEFTHCIYNSYNDGWFTGKSIDPALAEGAARYVETFYRISPNPFDNNVRTMTLLGPALRADFASFNGKIPTGSQIYGTGATADFYYDLAATCFSYLASQYGVGFTFQSIRDAYANNGGHSPASFPAIMVGRPRSPSRPRTKHAGQPGFGTRSADRRTVRPNKPELPAAGSGRASARRDGRGCRPIGCGQDSAP